VSSPSPLVVLSLVFLRLLFFLRTCSRCRRKAGYELCRTLLIPLLSMSPCICSYSALCSSRYLPLTYVCLAITSRRSAFFACLSACLLCSSACFPTSSSACIPVCLFRPLLNHWSALINPICLSACLQCLLVFVSYFCLFACLLACLSALPLRSLLASYLILPLAQNSLSSLLSYMLLCPWAPCLPLYNFSFLLVSLLTASLHSSAEYVQESVLRRPARIC
jgi:hypothetical protein